MADSEATYFGAIWTEDKDTPTGSLDVEKLRDLLEDAEANDQERIFFSAFPNERKDNDNQPDINLVHYPNKGKRGKKKNHSGFGSGGKKRSAAKRSRGRSTGGSKKSKLF